MSEQQARTLIKKYLAGQCTDVERALVEQYFNIELHDNRTSTTPNRIEEADRRMLHALVKHLIADQTRSIRLFHRWIPYAAAIILAALAGTWIFYGDQIVNRKSEIANVQDIPPGGNRATLKLADGRAIDLSSERSGIIVNGENIIYNDGTELELPPSGAGGLENVEELVLSTPKGGIYQVTLPDGSKIWLNAASKLKYPSRFTGDERVVELSGEAYFSVISDKYRPFKVVSAGQEIQVLGTEFNIAAYADESESKTTLVAGGIQILNRESKIVSKLQPGDQSTIYGAITDIQKVDVEPYTAWKNGYFYFKRTPIEEILRQVSRWYDVEVIYKRGIPRETFSGDIKRDVSLLGLLDILKLSTINVSLEGNTLIIL